jgi:hypothetical protein
VIYFIQAPPDGPVKIGYAAHPHLRLAALQVASAEPLELLAWLEGDRNLERAAHAHFADSRLRGEWFEPTPELLILADFASVWSAAEHIGDKIKVRSHPGAAINLEIRRAAGLVRG